MEINKIYDLIEEFLIEKNYQINEERGYYSYRAVKLLKKIECHSTITKSINKKSIDSLKSIKEKSKSLGIQLTAEQLLEMFEYIYLKDKELNPGQKVNQNLFNQIYWFNRNWIVDMEKYFDLIKDNHKESFFKILNQTNVGVWSFSEERLKKFFNYLDKNFEEKNITKFTLSFFKSFKSNMYNQVISNYLLERYNYKKDILEPLFESFPIIKNHFKEIELDIFEKQYKYTDYIKINYKKLNKLLGKRIGIAIPLTGLMGILKKEKFICSHNAIRNDLDEQNLFFYSNEVIDLEFIKNKMSGLIKVYIDNPAQLNDVKAIEAWYEKEKLNSFLNNPESSENSEDITIRKKLNKI